MSSDRIGAEACADNIDSDHFHSAIWVPGSLDSGAKPLAQIDSRQAAGCGGGFLTSSWQESRGSIGVSAPACTTKVVCNPDAGYPSIIALDACIVPMHAPQWKRYVTSFARTTTLAGDKPHP